MAKFSSVVEKVLAILLIGGPVAGIAFGGFVGGRYEINRGLASAIGFIVGLAISVLLLVLCMVMERFVMRRRSVTDNVTEAND